MAEAILAGVIWPSHDGTREHIVRVEEVTSEEDARFKQVRYRGYSPKDDKTIQLLMGGSF